MSGKAPLAVGVVGTGRMGAHIARHVLAAGHRTYVYDAVPAAYAALVEAGAVAARGPRDIAPHVDVAVTSLPGPAEVGQVALDLVAAAHTGLLVVETSTIGPAQSRTLAASLRAAGARYVDAPLSGGVEAARDANLTAMIGGDPADVARALPVLRCFAPRVRHMGPVGSGHVAKLINQLVYLGFVAAYSEATAVGRRAGLDVPVLLDVLRTSVAGDPLVTRWDERIETGDLQPGFPVARVLKDLELAGEVEAEAGGGFLVLESVLGAFRRAADLGFAAADMTAVHAIAAGIAAPKMRPC